MLGPGAHGRYHVNGYRHATIQRPSPQQWMKEVEQKGHGTAKSVKQSDYDIAGTIHTLHKAILIHELGLLADPLIEAIARQKFEDGLRTGVLLGGCWGP